MKLCWGKIIKRYSSPPDNIQMFESFSRFNLKGMALALHVLHWNKPKAHWNRVKYYEIPSEYDFEILLVKSSLEYPPPTPNSPQENKQGS